MTRRTAAFPTPPPPRLPRVLAAALVLVVFPLLSGCAVPVLFASAGVAAARAGSSAYVSGELESAEVTEMGVLFQVVQDALTEDLGFEIDIARAGDNYAYIHTSENQGRKIRVNLERKSPIVTKVNIRVGLLGDQPMSRLVLGAIQARTPAPPQRHPGIDELLRGLETGVQPQLRLE
jgi:hypothetical protein